MNEQYQYATGIDQYVKEKMQKSEVNVEGKERIQPTLERLFINLQKEVSNTDSSTVEIYNMLDRLNGIPREGVPQPEIPKVNTDKIIPSFQEEIWKLREINEVLSDIKYHLRDLIGE